MTRRIQNRPEEQLHREVAKYLAVVLPDDAWFCHVPNGGARTAAEGRAFKAMGAKAGTPDILIVHDGKAFWIELKPVMYKNRKHGGLSEAQMRCHFDLGHAGCQVAICYTVEQVEGTLRAWLPLKGRVAA